MEIKFRNKKASKMEQEQAFLKLSAQERFYAWLNLMYRSRSLPIKNVQTKNDNFIIQIPNEKK